MVANIVCGASGAYNRPIVITTTLHGVIQSPRLMCIIFCILFAAKISAEVPAIMMAYISLSDLRSLLLHSLHHCSLCVLCGGNSPRALNYIYYCLAYASVRWFYRWMLTLIQFRAYTLELITSYVRYSEIGRSGKWLERCSHTIYSLTYKKMKY